MTRIAVLCSGRGSTLDALVAAQAPSGPIKGTIALVIANRKSAPALEKARNYGIEALFVSRKAAGSDEAFDEAVIEALKAAQIDLVVLAGYLAVHGRRFVEAFPNRILNLHPSLIPAFCGKGFYGEHVHRAVLDYGVKLTGATVHFANEETDGGPIILQRAVPVLEGDTPETLAARTLPVEHALMIEACALFCEGRLRVEGRRVSIV